MAEYLRFQLNTPPHVNLTSMVGTVGAHVMKLRFQQKVKKSSSLLALVDSQVHRRSFRANYDQVSEMMDNVNYLFYLGANCNACDLPDYSILTRAEKRPGLPSTFPPKKASYLREMPRSSASLILRLRCNMLKVKANLATEEEGRNCSTCHVLEDEKHVFDVCPKFDDIRQKYSPDEVAYSQIYSEDPKQLLKIADFAEKVETALLLEG